MNLDERLRLYIGDLVVQLQATIAENEMLKERLSKDGSDVPEQKKRQKTNAQVQAGDGAAANAQVS